MKIIRNIIVAFSLYSKIPMPIWEWKEDDMKYAIAFLPFVGVVIGAVEYLSMLLADYLYLPLVARIAIWMVIPLIITGGFHVDGFMDVCDALKSYKPKEEKLLILKDPHIGAFSVISLATYGLIYMGFTAIIMEAVYDYGILCKDGVLLIACMSFVLVRAMCSLVSIKLKKAKSDGMLHEETKDTNKATGYIISTELVIIFTAMIVTNYVLGLAAALLIIIYTQLFKRKMYREFGGISGDMTGYYIVMGELIVLICAAVYACIF